MVFEWITVLKFQTFQLVEFSCTVHYLISVQLYLRASKFILVDQAITNYFQFFQIWNKMKTFFHTIYKSNNVQVIMFVLLLNFQTTNVHSEFLQQLFDLNKFFNVTVAPPTNGLNSEFMWPFMATLNFSNFVSFSNTYA